MFASPGAMNLNTIFKIIYNYRTEKNKQMLRVKRKKSSNTNLKYDKMDFNQNLTNFTLSANILTPCNLDLALNFNKSDCRFLYTRMGQFQAAIEENLQTCPNKMTPLFLKKLYFEEYGLFVS